MNVSAINSAASIASGMDATASEVSMAMLGKSLDTAKQQGEALARMIGQQAGLGRTVDTVA